MTSGLSNPRDCQWRAQLTTLCPGGKGECGSKVLLNFVPQPYALTSSRVRRTTYLMLSEPSDWISCAWGQPAVRGPYHFERAANHTWKNVEPHFPHGSPRGRARHEGCGKGEMARLQARVDRAVVAGGRQLEMPTGIYHRHVLHCVLAPSPLHYKQLCAFLPASIPGEGHPGA